MKKVAIIGHFGGKEAFWDGQTIKTKNLEALLLGQSDLSVRRVDTYYSKRNKIKLFADTLKALLFCEDIFLLVSVNGMRVFLPLLYYINRVTKRRIYHYVIGSELLELIEKDKRLIKYLNALAGNWFEYESGSRYLRERGVNNVTTVPNFKNITPVAEVTEYCAENGIYKFCTFSRVMREKGITDAIEAVARINKENVEKVVKLDIYGPIEAAYREEFEKLLELHSECVTYKGCVDSQKSVDVLKDYYALLFPTHWAGEGFPGTILDAFAAGLPVIATDWNANKEILEDMKTGIIYPSEKVETLYDAVNWAINNTKDAYKMRIECRAKFTEYMPETILEFILQEINS